MGNTCGNKSQKNLIFGACKFSFCSMSLFFMPCWYLFVRFFISNFSSLRYFYWNTLFLVCFGGRFFFYKTLHRFAYAFSPFDFFFFFLSKNTFMLFPGLELSRISKFLKAIASFEKCFSTGGQFIAHKALVGRELVNMLTLPLLCCIIFIKLKT